MRSLPVMAISALLALAACGGSSAPIDAAAHIDAAAIDAPHVDASAVDASAIDAAVATVQTVDCASVTPTATVTTTNNVFAYSPVDTTIQVNQVVKFQMASQHNVVPNPGTGRTTDSGLTVGFGATACLKFTQLGTFSFKCFPHGFAGTVTVNPVI